ncbi:DgyrCDS911 [Dimorphilus gyrociliatus]|uniref:DgyrCDS911 n=1 Tax=Dimorphilus gyrociliatus TaxID=2664684 RepID=A0A7I8V8T3_9ANNE|nr:DgyrCDS911 [Dimorphilus gyrociliatus]
MNKTTVWDIGHKPGRLSCAFNASPRSTIQWFKNGKLITDNKYLYRVEESHTDSVLHKFWTTISSIVFYGYDRGINEYSADNTLNPSDAGIYTCVVSNTYGKIQSETELIIEFPPIVTTSTPFAAVDIKDNIPAVLQCAVHSVPSSTVEWYKGDKLLSPQERISIENGKGEKFESSLSIIKVSKLDYGNYRCVATNKYNEKGETSVVLQEKSRPNQIKDFKLSSRTWNSLNLYWTPGFDGGETQSFKLVYTKKNSNQLPLHIEKITQNRYNLTGLEPDNNYEVTIYPFNIMGFGPPTSSLTFKTSKLLLPVPQRIEYYFSKRILSYRVPSSAICVKVEIYEKDWKILVTCAPHGNGTYKVSSKFSPKKIRVSFCSRHFKSICGPNSEALFVYDDVEEQQAISTGTVIIIGIVSVSIVLILLIIVIFTIIKRRKPPSQKVVIDEKLDDSLWSRTKKCLTSNLNDVCDIPSTVEVNGNDTYSYPHHRLQRSCEIPVVLAPTPSDSGSNSTKKTFYEVRV